MHLKVCKTNDAPCFHVDNILGPEKLLELWVAPSAACLPPSAGPEGLKRVPLAAWNDMLDLVHCKVLSVIESEHVDAYLLSESSMFVYPHKLVLKTCGITTLLCGIPKMLQIAVELAGFPVSRGKSQPELGAAAQIHRVFYSRKNFIYPDQQRGPHRSWRDEVRALDRLFHGGSAYMIGKMNGEHWYLYITDPHPSDKIPATNTCQRSEIGSVNHSSVKSSVAKLPESDTNRNSGDEDDDDETLEILMTDLEEENAKQFYLGHASAVAEGQYYHESPDARRQFREAFGKMQTRPAPSNGSVNAHTNGARTSSRHVSTTEDDFFAQTCDKDTGLSSDDEDHSLPSELTTEGHALGSVVSNHCGLDKVYPKTKYPNAKIDAYLFTPCGFSANGVVPAPRQASLGDEHSKADLRTHYFTVHVTPEPECSYASFETNVPARQTGRETAEVVEQVVGIFQPKRFSVTLFEAKSSVAHGTTNGLSASNGHKTVARIDAIKGYRRVDRIVHDLDGYDLVFRHFEKVGWEGGAPRLGEVL